MKTNLRERLTMYQCFITPKVHFAPEFSFNFATDIRILSAEPMVNCATVFPFGKSINKKMVILFMYCSFWWEMGCHVNFLSSK